MRTVDPTGLVYETNSRGNDKIVGEIHRSPAGRFKVVMVGTAIAKSLSSYDEARDMAEHWVPTDPTTESILAQILEGQ
jgi:hypothetical protein